MNHLENSWENYFGFSITGKLKINEDKLYAILFLSNTELETYLSIEDKLTVQKEKVFLFY